MICANIFQRIIVFTHVLIAMNSNLQNLFEYQTEQVLKGLSKSSKSTLTDKRRAVSDKFLSHLVRFILVLPTKQKPAIFTYKIIVVALPRDASHLSTNAPSCYLLL